MMHLKHYHRQANARRQKTDVIKNILAKGCRKYLTTNLNKLPFILWNFSKLSTIREAEIFTLYINVNMPGYCIIYMICFLIRRVRNTLCVHEI